MSAADRRLFFAGRPLDGGNFRELRGVFFTDPDGALELEHIPDGRMDVDREMLRYRTYRFANRLGFKPPYLYHHGLRKRLQRYRNPALILWGAEDRFVPTAPSSLAAVAITVTLRSNRTSSYGIPNECQQSRSRATPAAAGCPGEESSRRGPR